MCVRMLNTDLANLYDKMYHAMYCHILDLHFTLHLVQYITNMYRLSLYILLLLYTNDFLDDFKICV